MTPHLNVTRKQQSDTSAAPLGLAEMMKGENQTDGGLASCVTVHSCTLKMADRMSRVVIRLVPPHSCFPPPPHHHHFVDDVSLSHQLSLPAAPPASFITRFFTAPCGADRC